MLGDGEDGHAEGGGDAGKAEGVEKGQQWSREPVSGAVCVEHEEAGAEDPRDDDEDRGDEHQVVQRVLALDVDGSEEAAEGDGEVGEAEHVNVKVPETGKVRVERQGRGEGGVEVWKIAHDNEAWFPGNLNVIARWKNVTRKILSPRQSGCREGKVWRR